MIRMHKLLGNRHVYAINYITISAVAPLAKRQHEKIKKYAVYLFEIWIHIIYAIKELFWDLKEDQGKLSKKTKETSIFLFILIIYRHIEWV